MWRFLASLSIGEPLCLWCGLRFQLFVKAKGGRVAA